MERQLMERHLAQARAAELNAQSDSRRTSVTSPCSTDLERLHEELLEIKPQKLLRQHTLSVPPGGGMKRSGLLDAPTNVLEDVLSRWEQNQIKWRRLSVQETSRSEMQQALDDYNDSSTNSTLSDGGEMFVDLRRSETFDVTFGEGFLGLEFVFDVLKKKVVIKSIITDSTSKAVMEITPGGRLSKGLAVDAINGKSVLGIVPEDILDKLQFSTRPMTVKFTRTRKSAVVCKLCETRVDAKKLDDHTNFCVLSKRVELEADMLNSALLKLVAAMTATLEARDLKPPLTKEEMHILHALRVAAIQASSCDVTSVDSFALCSRLVKILYRIRDKKTEDFDQGAIDRGTKYCANVRNLIHAKMSKMRSSHKVILQQSPDPKEVVRSPFKRTKSLEDLKGANALKTSRRQSKTRPATYRVTIRDFQIIKPISKGAFGKVYLSRKKTTGDQYAIKVLAKEHLLRKKQMRQIATERNVLANVVSPFVVKLFWTFQTKRNLYLVMEYLPGGDFMSLLECIVQLEEQVACIYIAEIAIALNHLHSKGCVHRDLKPDNVLLSSAGHIKLTDFGLSEEGVALDDTDSEPDDESIAPDILSGALLGEVPSNNSPHDSPSKKKSKTKKSIFQTFGRCGTPDYLAPEIVLGVAHGPAVDFWALGVILYEMLVGFPPFNDDTVDAIFENILERQILWPDGEKCLSLEAMNLIEQLLDPNPSTRLGFEGMKLHPFFKTVNWDTILDAVPPFVPTLEGPNDTSYFNNRDLTEIVIDNDEFETDSRSAGSSQVDESGPEYDESPLRSFEGKGDIHLSSASNVSNTSSKSASNNSDADVSWGLAGQLHSLAAAPRSFDNQTSDEVRVEDNNVHNRFPSGMYGGLDDSPLTDAFKSFSFTNMNALAAASQAEAEILADPQQRALAAASAPSIII